MQGSFQRRLAEIAFISQQQALAAEQAAIEEAVEALPEPFLAHEEGDIEHPIELGSYRQRRKAARGQ